MRLPAIIVNRHALARARERHSVDLAAYDDRAVRDLILADVRSAIREGRRDDRHPSWTGRRTHHEGETFAWTEDMRRIYVLRGDGNGRIFVTTVLGGPTERRSPGR